MGGTQRGRAIAAMPRVALSGAFYRTLQRRAPRAYLRLIRWRGADFYPVTRDCDLVIAGAPGSANSFARAAILVSNPQLQVSSHAHVWTEVRDAVRFDRPVLLLIRDPLSAVASRMTRFGNVTAAQAFRDYAAYHRHVLRWGDQVVVADFDEVTARLGDVVVRVNDRFGCAIVPFPHADPDALSGLHTLLASANGAVPSASRGAQTAALRQALLGDDLARLRVRCQGLYAELRERAGGEPVPPAGQRA